MAEAMIGAIGALVILALVFGCFLAFLPLLVGGVSVLATFLIVGGLTEITGISQIVEFLIALDRARRGDRLLAARGVAGGVKSALPARPTMTRWPLAMQHAGRAVVFSGLTVAIGLLSMIVLPVPMLRSVGYGGVLVPLVSVAVAITLLPVILASVGPRLDWPRLRTERRPSRVFSAWAALVYRHKWVAAVAGLGDHGAADGAGAVAAPGRAGESARGDAGPAHDALVSLTSGGVPSGVLTPAEVLTSAFGGAVGGGAGGGPARRVRGRSRRVRRRSTRGTGPPS